jgi:DNA-binding MarR family transcriptional regulator/GNAT superfamily N-acetyltransferase
MPVADPEVAALRDFNRFYTRRIGVLQDGLLGTAHPLPQARVLYELGRRPDGVDTSDLRRELGLDAGYLSRMLARLEQDGLVVRARDPADGRRLRVRLTAAGGAAFADLDARSAAAGRRLLDDVPAPARRRLAAALATARAALEDRAPDVRLRTPEAGDLGWIVERHGALYAREHGWDASFEALCAGIVAAFAARHDPARERAWIADVAGERAGCVLCVDAGEPATARLRLLLVEPWARGLGIGGRLVDAVLAFARAAGYERVILWTNDVLHDARRLYERAGFALVAEAPHHAFGHDLVEQTWSLEL